MAPNIRHSTKAAQSEAGEVEADGFQLDFALVEVGDVAGLFKLTDDGCGSTCGACTTDVA